MGQPHVVCPDCGMSTWVDGFGCALPGCENYGAAMPTPPEEMRCCRCPVHSEYKYDDPDCGCLAVDLIAGCPESHFESCHCPRVNEEAS